MPNKLQCDISSFILGVVLKSREESNDDFQYSSVLFYV